jgi:hypothetical protein
MSFEAFRQLSGQVESLVDLLAMPENAAEVELEPARWEMREERF